MGHLSLKSLNQFVTIPVSVYYVLVLASSCARDLAPPAGNQILLDEASLNRTIEKSLQYVSEFTHGVVLLIQSNHRISLVWFQKSQHFSYRGDSFCEGVGFLSLFYTRIRTIFLSASSLKRHNLKPGFITLSVNLQYCLRQSL